MDNIKPTLKQEIFRAEALKITAFVMDKNTCKKIAVGFYI